MSVALSAGVEPDAPPAPVVIVGSGPVGIRSVKELHRRAPELPILIYGAEPFEPYNRVRLSSFLSGELGWSALTSDFAAPRAPVIEARFGCAVKAIDRDAKQVLDAAGRSQAYAWLVLATGSRPHVPEIEGIRLPGVYTFRDLADAQSLLARRTRSRRTIVLGGGLLGIEAARAMSRFHTEVVLVEHSGRLLPRQLDSEAAGILQRHVEGLGIRIVNADGLARVLGDVRVAGVALRSGRTIECDTLVVAVGIRPNIELARRAGLAFGRGIRVDDGMRTSDPSIFAVGECAEHRGQVYGLIAPGIEQAEVAAARIAGEAVCYAGSTVATRLKVLGMPVFSVGRVSEDDRAVGARVWTHRAQDGAGCSKLVIEHGHLVGGCTVGSSTDPDRLHDAVARGRRIWPWQLRRFRRTGEPWVSRVPERVAQWPAGAPVCRCNGVSRGTLSDAVASGCGSLEALAATTGAGTVCGSCRPLLLDLLGSPARPEPVPGGTVIAAVGGAALLAALAIALPVDLPYASSVRTPGPWDLVARDALVRQLTGYASLGFGLVALLLSLRRRFAPFRFGAYAAWRVVHVVVGCLAVVGLLVHTGGRVGANLDRALMTCFLALIGVGGWAGGVIALEHRLGSAAQSLRRRSVWLHVLLFWPIPLLLGLHVLKAYYF